MANQPLTNQADINAQILLDALRTFQRAKTEKERKLAADDILKAARSLNINDAQTQTLTKILSQPGDLAELAIKTIDALANKRAQQLIDLQRNWANAFQRQGDAVTGMASVARTIATIASLFGAEDFATMLHAKADEQMQKAGVYYAQGLSKMKEDAGTAQIVSDAIKDGLKVVADRREDFDVTRATIKASVQAGKQDVSNPYTLGAQDAVPAPDTPSTPANRVLTWKQFHENMASVGVSKDAQNQMRKIYDGSAAYDSSMKSGVIDSPVEVTKLLAGIKKTDALTAPQKDALYRKLNLNAPEPSPS